jgi:hypothetical protein
MTAKLARLKPPFPQAEANIFGRFYLAHVDGCVYVPDDLDHAPHIEALTTKGGYYKVPYPKFPSPIWAAINTLTDALNGTEQQIILDAVECVLQSFEADVERTWPAV